jgi:toxin ParE1/3/4
MSEQDAIRSRIFGPLAQLDLEDALLKSMREWGVDQGFAYAELLDKGFETITRFPEIGKRRNDLREGLRIFPAGQHQMLYRFDDREVRVLRIADARRDLRSLVDELPTDD